MWGPWSLALPHCELATDTQQRPVWWRSSGQPGLHRRRDSDRADRVSTACHRFVAGHTVASLAPLAGALCVKSSQIYAAMATATGNRSDVVLAWDPRDSRANSRPNSCLALVSFPSMQVMGSLAVDLASAVLHDKVTGSIIMLSFSPSQTIVADQYHAATLKPMLRYSIPISVAWLLHAPKMSDGYLLFLGSEAPFVGSIFAVDLRRQLIYQQGLPKPRIP